MTCKSAWMSWLIIGFLAADVVHAMTIFYSDFVGDSVVFVDVTEDTGDESHALFGMPSIQGNLLDFDPTSFAAGASSVTGTSESDGVDGHLAFSVRLMDESVFISGLFFRAAGDYALAGLGSVLAEASVETIVRYTIDEVDGVPITPVMGSSNLTFTPGDSFRLPPPGAGSWSGFLNVDPVSLLQANNIDGSATKIEVSLDNIMSASASDGGSAAIAKKDFQVFVLIEPEPAGALMMILAMLAFCHAIQTKRCATP